MEDLELPCHTCHDVEFHWILISSCSFKGRADLADTYRGGAHPLNATCSNVPEAMSNGEIGDSNKSKKLCQMVKLQMLKQKKMFLAKVLMDGF